MASLASIGRQTFSGRVVRSIAPRGKGFEECFSLLTNPDTPDTEPVEFLGKNYSLVDVRQFEDEPKVYPQAVYERFIASEVSPEEFVAGFFDGNRVKDSITVDGHVSELRIVTPEPMGDAEFWDLIAVLGGGVSHSAMERLTLRLATLSEGKIVGFHDELIAKLAALDHPDNAVRTRMGGREMVSDDASLYYRCWIVAQGPEVFEFRRKEPGVVLPRGRWQTSELLLEVARNAMDAATGGASVKWTPAPQLMTGSNLELWGELGVPSRPIPPPHTLVTLQNDLDERGRRRGIENPQEDAFYNAHFYGQWFAARMLTHVADGFVETVVHWTVFDGSDPVTVFQNYAVTHAVSLGGALVATDPVSPTNARCSNGEMVYRIRRTSPLNRDAYLDRFYHGKLTGQK